MAQRPGFVHNHFIKADGRWPLTKSPNQQPDVITAEIRCHWPHTAPQEEIIAALTAVFAKAITDVRERFENKQDLKERNVWLREAPSSPE